MTVGGLFPIFVRQGKSATRFKVGYIDSRGNTVIDPIFDQGTRFYEGLAAVEIRGRWGVINIDGGFAINPKPWSRCRFSEGRASISVNGKWGIVDRDGSFVVEPRYHYLESFREGLAVFRTGDGHAARYGFVDRDGVEVIPAVFHDARGFSQNLAATRVGSLWGYIAPSGVFRITPRFDGAGRGRRWPDVRAGYFVNDLAPVWIAQDRYRFIDTSGHCALEGDFEDANSFCEGRAAVMINRQYGFIDTQGRIAVNCRFNLVRDFSEGLARVEEKGAPTESCPLSGFVDREGQMVIDPVFSRVHAFRDGLSLVTTKDLIGYINRLGEFVWQGQYVEYGTVA
jgi:hypothetical protein